VARDAAGATHAVVRGLRAGGARFGDPYDPVLSADGARLAYTQSGGRVGDPRSARSWVQVRDVRTGRVLAADRSGTTANPGLSPDGRFVAFVSTPRGGPAGLLLRDLDSGRVLRIPTGGALPLDPVVADGGAVVAFAAVRDGRSEIRAWSAATGTVQVVSRAGGPGGAVADGWSEGPSISGDGRRIAFASTATNLDPAKRDDTRAIFVRDLAAASTRLVSDVGVAYAVGG
jgi:Tol biopolymer transport system component